MRVWINDQACELRAMAARDALSGLAQRLAASETSRVGTGLGVADRLGAAPERAKGAGYLPARTGLRAGGRNEVPVNRKTIRLRFNASAVRWACMPYRTSPR